MKSFKDWKISTKVMGISLFTVVVVMLGMLFYIVPQMEDKLIDQKQGAIKT